MIRSVALVTNDTYLYKTVKLALEDLDINFLPMISDLKRLPEVYQKEFFSLVLVDYFLTDTTGLEALKFMAKINEEIPAIFLARLNSRNIIESAYRMGASDCVEVPFSKDFLKSVVAHRLSHIKEAGTVYFDKIT